MPRPRTVQEALQAQYPDNDWSDFAPVCPDTLAPVHDAIAETWELPWRFDVWDRPIDTARTRALADWDAAVRCTVEGVVKNVHDGVPFAYVDGEREYPVYDRRNIFRHTRVPMPNPVPRLGDPTGYMSDLQFFGIDRLGLWELASIGPAWWRGFGDMAAQNFTRWLYATNWFDQRTGMTGGKVPFLPMLPAFDEFETGIHHALHMVILYGREDHVYPARNSDPLLKRRKGMPLRAGERLRLAVTETELEARMGRKLTLHERHVRDCMEAHGVIVDDIRPAPDALIRMPMDHRVDVDLHLRLTDYVVLAPIARQFSLAA